MLWVVAVLPEDAVAVVESVRFLLVGARWVVVECRVRLKCRVDRREGPAGCWLFVVAVVARLVRLVLSWRRHRLRALVGPSSRQSRWPCGSGWALAVVDQDVEMVASPVGPG